MLMPQAAHCACMQPDAQGQRPVTSHPPSVGVVEPSGLSDPATQASLSLPHTSCCVRSGYSAVSHAQTLIKLATQAVEDYLFKVARDERLQAAEAAGVRVLLGDARNERLLLEAGLAGARPAGRSDRLGRLDLRRRFQEAAPAAGQDFVFIPKGKGVLLMTVPEPEELRGLARGASSEGYRDRSDRF